MPARIIPLVTGQIYHIFNRGINKQPIFLGISDYIRILDLLEFYSFAAPKLRFSKFLLLSHAEKSKFWESVRQANNKIVEFMVFCLMPNHFHLLLQQKKDGGISKFMAIFQNSYTRYFNIKHKKIGTISQGQFKAVRVEDDYQLLHLSRYIHLNPYSSFVVKSFADIESYPWSSFPEYLGRAKTEICNTRIILANFQNVKKYQKFVLDQADYQRDLEKIKHQVLES